jgi:hypothetical protein
MHVQRTRLSPSALRAPLTRHPFGHFVMRVHKRSRVVFLLIAVASVSGCTAIRVTYVDPTPRNQTEPSSIQVLRGEPPRAYQVVARFQFADKGWNLSETELNRRIRIEAARLGGEAALVEQMVQNHLVSEGLLIGHTAEVSQRVLFVRVIVFKQSGVS